MKLAAKVITPSRIEAQSALQCKTKIMTFKKISFIFQPRHNNMRQFIGLWTVALVVVVLAALSLDSMGVAAYSNQPYQNGMRINRRGFKSSLLSTARGFGKRSDPSIAEPLAEADSMPAAYETINPRLLAYLLKEEAAAGEEARGWPRHRPEEY